MNKAYRIVWSHARSAWVVASELARGATKARSASRATRALIARVVLSASIALTPMSQVLAANYFVSNEADLRQAFQDALADPDPNATITLTANISVAAAAFSGSGSTKPITIDTNGFTLSGLAGPDGSTSPSRLLFSGSTLVLDGSLRGGDAFPSSNLGGAIGLDLTGSSVTNNGSITGGTSDASQFGGAGAAYYNGSSFINNGTVSGGAGGVIDATNTGGGGTGVSFGSGGSLVNNGTIRGGASTGSGGGGIGVSAISGTATLTNTGTIQGGSNPTAGVGPSIRVGVSVGSGPFTANATINNSGTIEGGVGARAIYVATNASSLTLISSGTIRAGAGQTTAIEFSTNNTTTSVLELRAGSVIEGNVLMNSLSPNEIFRLGGDADATFDVSTIGTQYIGFMSGGFEKTGASTWTLTGSHAGAIARWTLRGGTLSVSSLDQLGTHSTIIDGATLRITAPITSTRSMSFGAGGATIHTDGDFSSSGLTTGLGALTKRGSATLTLTNSFNGWTGGTTIAAGTLQVGNGAGVGVLPGNVVDNATLAFNRNNALTYSGLISGSGEVIQRGTGTTVFTANHTYTGATKIEAGTLRSNGDQSAATGLVSVANGGTLGGSGIIGGAVTVADGGRLAPGNSPGTLTMGALTLSGGSILDVELGEANVAGGTLNDLMNVNGDLTLDGTLNVALSAGGTYGAGIYRLINYTGALTNNGFGAGTHAGELGELRPDLGCEPSQSHQHARIGVELLGRRA